MQNGELLIWGDVAKSIPHPFPTAPLVLGPVSIAPLRVFVLVLAAGLIVTAYLLIHTTRLGTAMRATFQDRDTAALMGVRIGRMHTATFAFGSGLAAAAGALLGPVFLAYPSMGDLASLKAFSVVILGGLGNLPGATLGGLLLGVAEEFGAGYVSSGYRDAVGFVIIFGVLALSLNLLLGYTGQLSLGHAAFFGIGAYASALLTLRLEWSFWLALPGAVALAALAGWLIGRLALKLRGAYFVLVTISFAGVVALVSVNWMELTNGPLGLPGVPAPTL